MDSTKQIISDLQQKIGFNRPLDFLSNWKGVPVMIKGHIQKIREESVVFGVEAPDSICFSQDDTALILYDIFIMGIEGRILAFNPKNGTVELGELAYVDSGFGHRSMVRVEPDNPIAGTLVFDGATLSCKIADLSLDGIGFIAESIEGLILEKGQAVSLKMSLLDQEIEIFGSILDIFPKDDSIRLAMSISQDASSYAIVTRYITHRRSEIRQEIQATYQQAIEKS